MEKNGYLNFIFREVSLCGGEKKEGRERAHGPQNKE